jgi:SAM-dependent methyltransferase
MPEMSIHEKLFCCSPPWRWFAARAVLPWALDGEEIHGDVLELGSGSGAISEALLDRSPAIRLTATDFDASMVATTARSIARFGERGTARQADAADLPFADASFDAVLALLMLHHVGEWRRALAESCRVLRSGGALVGYDLLAGPIAGALHRIGVRKHGETLIPWLELRPALERFRLRTSKPFALRPSSAASRRRVSSRPSNRIAPRDGATMT